MKKLFLFLLIFAGCISTPEKKDFECEECFYHAYCLYLNQKNPDKASCASLDEACSDAVKEARQRARLEFCREFCYDGVMSEETCRLLLNQR